MLQRFLSEQTVHITHLILGCRSDVLIWSEMMHQKVMTLHGDATSSIGPANHQKINSPVTFCPLMRKHGERCSLQLRGDNQSHSSRNHCTMTRLSGYHTPLMKLVTFIMFCAIKNSQPWLQPQQVLCGARDKTELSRVCHISAWQTGYSPQTSSTAYWSGNGRRMELLNFQEHVGR